MAGADLGGHRHEFALQIFDVLVAKMLVEPVAETLTGDEPRAGEIEIEIAEDALARQIAGKILDGVQVAGDIAAADDGADGGARHDVRFDAGVDEGLENTDMGPAARRAAAQGQSDLADAHGFLRLSAGPVL